VAPAGFIYRGGAPGALGAKDPGTRTPGEKNGIEYDED